MVASSQCVVGLIFLLGVVTYVSGGVVTSCESGEVESSFCDPRDVMVTMNNCFNVQTGCKFTTSFIKPPAVTHGLIHIDSDKAYNTRLAVDVQASPRGLTVTFQCWANSWCYRARISWMACGLIYV